MNQLQAVIFDMDGVLIDTHRCAYAVLIECAAQFGVSLTLDEVMRWGSMSGRQFWTKVKADYQLHESVEVLMRSYDYDREISFYSDIGLMPGVSDFIEMLYKRGMLLGLATSAERLRIQAVFDLGLNASYFNAIVSASDVARHKPDPECYLKSCGILQVAPERTLVIEDSSNGANAARGAGCKLAAFHGSMWQFDSFDADFHISSFESLHTIEQLWPNNAVGAHLTR